VVLLLLSCALASSFLLEVKNRSVGGLILFKNSVSHAFSKS
jgi:hypothetical protein